MPLGGVNPPLHGEAKSPPHRPWTLPPQGLVVFHGDKDTARLSHYFLPRLLLQGKRVLMLDGANCADPRLLERLARQRRVPFEQFSRQIQIARAFTCFQLTELIARVPRLLTDFPAEVLIVTAFPELYYDEDVRDWNAQVAFEQALANLWRWAGSAPATLGGREGLPDFIGTGRPPAGARRAPLPDRGRGKPLLDSVPEDADLKVSATREPVLPLTVAVFSSATTFIPSSARKRFFEKTCAVAAEVWRFSLDADHRLMLACTRRALRLGEVTSEKRLNQ